MRRYETNRLIVRDVDLETRQDLSGNFVFLCGGHNMIEIRLYGENDLDIHCLECGKIQESESENGERKDASGRTVPA